jgi:type IV pilus assembly protein PilV
MADMVRGNRTVAAVKTDNPYIGSSQAAATGELVPANPVYCLSVGLGATAQCNDSTQLAKAQLTEWLARVSSTLPGARVVICADSDPYDTAGLARWNCSPGLAAPIVIKIGWSRRALKAATDGTATIELATSGQSTPSVMVAVVP